MSLTKKVKCKTSVFSCQTINDAIKNAIKQILEKYKLESSDKNIFEYDVVEHDEHIYFGMRYSKYFNKVILNFKSSNKLKSYDCSKSLCFTFDTANNETNILPYSNVIYIKKNKTNNGWYCTTSLPKELHEMFLQNAFKNINNNDNDNNDNNDIKHVQIKYIDDNKDDNKNINNSDCDNNDNTYVVNSNNEYSNSNNIVTDDNITVDNTNSNIDVNNIIDNDDDNCNKNTDTNTNTYTKTNNQTTYSNETIVNLIMAMINNKEHLNQIIDKLMINDVFINYLLTKISTNKLFINSLTEKLFNEKNQKYDYDIVPNYKKSCFINDNDCYSNQSKNEINNNNDVGNLYSNLLNMEKMNKNIHW